MIIVLRNRNIRKIGNSYYLSIPVNYVQNGLIELSKRYDADLEERGD